MSLVIQILRQIARRWYLWTFLPIYVAFAVFYATGKGGNQFVSESALFLNLPTNKGLSITNEEYKQHEISAYIQDLIQLTHSRKSMEYIKLSVLKGYLQHKNTLLKAPKDAFPWSESEAVVQRIDYLISRNEMLDLKQDLDAKITIYMRDQGITNESLKSLFKLYREGASNYLRLQVTTGDPFTSSYIGEQIIEAMLRLNKHINQGKLEADQKLFEKLVEQAKDDLNEKVKNLENYKITHNVINLPEHTKAIVNQMVQLEVQKAELVELLASKQEGIYQIKTKLGVKEEIPVDLSKNAEFIELQKRIRNFSSADNGELRKNMNLEEIGQTSNNLEELVKEYVTDVPIDIRKARQELTQQYLNFQVELEMTKQLIPLVDAEIERISIYARTFAPLESNIGTLEREITTAQETFLILVNKLNLAKTVVQGTGTNELVVIDSPNVPLNPIPSKRKILVLISFVLSFVIVIVLIAALEYLDSGIWSSKDFKSVFGEVPFSVLPELEGDEDSQDDQLTDYLRTIRNEQIKSLAIKISSLAKDSFKEVVLISSLKGEGKEELALALGDRLNTLGFGTDIQSISEHGNSVELADSVDASSKISVTILPPVSVYTHWQNYLDREVIFIWMYHAGRAPLAADTSVLNKIQESEVLTVLNQVLPDYLEDSGANVVRKRSWIRILVKRILTLQFKAKSQELAL